MFSFSLTIIMIRRMDLLLSSGTNVVCVLCWIRSVRHKSGVAYCNFYDLKAFNKRWMKSKTNNVVTMPSPKMFTEESTTVNNFSATELFLADSGVSRPAAILLLVRLYSPFYSFPSFIQSCGWFFVVILPNPQHVRLQVRIPVNVFWIEVKQPTVSRF